MSDSLMPFQPEIEEPSNILPSSKVVVVEGVGGKRHVMLHAEHVGETQVDELDAFGLDGFENVVGGHGRTRAGNGYSINANDMPSSIINKFNHFSLTAKIIAPK